jgi:zinc protease
VISTMPRLMRSFTAFALVMLFNPQAYAAMEYKKVAEKKLFNGEVLQEFRLPNGLQVLLLPRHQAEVLTYQVWFRVGSIQEKIDPKLKKTGLAHLFEHMMFRGSKKYPDGEFDKLTAQLGAEGQNATTYYYRTNYYENIPSKKLEALMELEADRMANLRLDKDLLEKEKGAVVGELRRGMDNPTRKAWDELMALANGQTPYRYTVIGTEAEIKGFTVEEAEYFYRTFYAPNNATLIVVGDAKEETLMPLVMKYYGAMKSQEIPSAPVPKEPLPTKERRVATTHKQATSETLMVAYPIPPVTSDETAPLSLLSTHLSTGMESVFRKKLVDTGLAVSASASTGAQPDLFQIMVQMVEGKKSEAALKIVDQEIAALTKKPIDKDSFVRAVNQDKLSLYSDMANNASMGNWLGEYLMLCNDYMRGFEILHKLNKVTPAEVTKVAKAYLVPSRRSIVIMRPSSSKASVEQPLAPAPAAAKGGRK